MFYTGVLTIAIEQNIQNVEILVKVRELWDFYFKQNIQVHRYVKHVNQM